MTSVLIKDLLGKEIGKRDLAANVFDIEPNMHLVHAALQRQLANARTGSANTKTRSEVRGGGRKPWRQKGTGRARAGSIRSPLWNGGGVTFGPKPRDYSMKLPRKARQLALRSALAARKNDIVLVQNFDSLFKTAPKTCDEIKEQPKTKQVALALKSLGLTEKWVLVILDHMVPGTCQVEKACRNIPNLKVIDYTNLNIKDLAQCDVVLTTEQVIAEIEHRYSTNTVSAKTESLAQEAEHKQEKKKVEVESSKKEVPVKKTETKPTLEKVEAAPAKETKAEVKKAEGSAKAKKQEEKPADAKAKNTPKKKP